MEINKKHTLFGDRAQRVSTDESIMVASFIYDLVRDRRDKLFHAFALTPSLKCKTDHGDIDIVYHLASGTIQSVVSELFEDAVLDTHKNGDVYSVLLRTDVIGKTVHVDFIESNASTFQTKLQYFSYNDFSGIFGMLSKKYRFKYGSEGFFKRYRDSKGNWHDVLVSRDLTVGMELLGYDPERWKKIENYKDIVNFMLSSPMFDYRLFLKDTLNQSDKKSYKRPVIKFVVDCLRDSHKCASIYDEDHFFKNTTAYYLYQKEVSKIEEKIKERALERERRLANDSAG